jgi:DNA excision repair protein ERCC-2
LIVSKGSDQLPMSTQYKSRDDLSVMINYGRLLIDLSAVVPDGMVAFFTSYRLLEDLVSQWHERGIIEQILKYKLLFIETKDIVETTLALEHYKKACDSGRGALFLSVARGKVAEGIDFDRHYGRCVVMVGVPFQYTRSRVLQARLQFLNDKHNIRESDFLSFDAIRQTSQCVGRVIRSKTDYGIMIFADQRFTRWDKISKLPRWVRQFIDKGSQHGISTDRAVSASREFLRHIAQPRNRDDELGVTLLDIDALMKFKILHAQEFAAPTKQEAEMKLAAKNAVEESKMQTDDDDHIPDDELMAIDI